MLVVNDIQIVQAGGVNKYGGLSLSTILHLSEGDEVYLALEGDHAIIGYSIPANHFSGFLLHAIL